MTFRQRLGEIRAHVADTPVGPSSGQILSRHILDLIDAVVDQSEESERRLEARLGELENRTRPMTGVSEAGGLAARIDEMNRHTAGVDEKMAMGNTQIPATESTDQKAGDDAAKASSDS